MNDLNNPLDDLIVKRYEEYIVDYTADVKAPPYLFFENEVGFSPLGDIQAIKAKAKNGKTQLTKILMASALCGECQGIRCGVEKAKVMYVDTEQSKYNSIRVMQNTLELCYRQDSEIIDYVDEDTHDVISYKKWEYNRKYDRFMGLSLRTVDTADRWPITLEAIEDFRPHLIIIDGIRDMIVDFNSLEEGSRMVGELMRVSADYECSIWNILHTNKNDDNMRGHLGTELTNKVSDVLEVTKAEENGCIVFKVKQTEARNKDIAQFLFEIDDNGIPRTPEMAFEVKNELDEKMRRCYEELRRRRNDSLGEDGKTYKIRLRRPDLHKVVMDLLDVKKVKAYDYINKAFEQDILYIDPVSNNIIYRGVREQNEQNPK